MHYFCTSLSSHQLEAPQEKELRFINSSSSDIAICLAIFTTWTGPSRCPSHSLRFLCDKAATHTKQPTVNFQSHISCLKQRPLLYILKASVITQHPYFNSEKTKAQRETLVFSQHHPGFQGWRGWFRARTRCLPWYLLLGDGKNVVRLSSLPNSTEKLGRMVLPSTAPQPNQAS